MGSKNWLIEKNNTQNILKVYLTSHLIYKILPPDQWGRTIVVSGQIPNKLAAVLTLSILILCQE